MNRKYFFYAIISFLLLLLTFGFSSLSTLALVRFDLILIFYLLIDSYNKKLWWVVIFIAFLNDLINPLNFGYIFILYLLVAWITYFLGATVFTNRSFYTVIFLGLAGSLTFKLALATLVIFNNFGIDWLKFFTQMATALVWELLFMSVLYFFIQTRARNRTI